MVITTNTLTAYSWPYIKLICRYTNSRGSTQIFIFLKEKFSLEKQIIVIVKSTVQFRILKTDKIITKSMKIKSVFYCY